MRFSIVVPVYNVEKYLAECTESILNQSFEDFELILVDDGSPDRCPEICDEYVKKDCRVKVVHKKNGGLSDARNAGIDVATGEYVLFVDSDDYWDSAFALEQINDVLEKHNADIVQYGHKKYFCIDDKIIDNSQRNLSQYNGYTTKEVIGKLVADGKLTISAWSMAVSREFLVKNDLYFKKGIKTEDLEWAIRLYVCEPVWAFMDDVFYVYRTQRNNSITSTVDYKHLCDYCWILENSISVVEKGSDSIEEPLMSYLMYHILIASAITYKVKMSKEQKREIHLRLKAVSKGRITKYTLNKKVKLASFIYRLSGYGMMARFLGFYLNNRG